MSRSPLRVLAGALLTLGVAGTLLATPSTAAAAPDTAKPVVGSCHAMTVAEGNAASDPDAAVSCGSTHTSRTFLVPTVPAGTRMTDLDALSRVVSKKCTPAWRQAVSTDIRQRLLSAYALLWFAPTRAQVSEGARWLRCDVVLLGGTRYGPLPAARRPALQTAPHPDNEARCFTGRRQGYATTVCTRPHQYRVKGVFQLSGRAYPSDAQRQRASARRCPSVAGPRWAGFSPTQSQWRAGFKYVYCANRTTR